MADFDLDQEPVENTDELINDIVSEEEVPVEITEPEELQAEEPAEEPEVEEIQALAPIESGAIGSTTQKVTKKKAAPKTKAAADQAEKVAIHSTRNVTWNGVGKVYRGYNIKPKEEAEKWLTRGHIRLATPEEVAREFGV